MRMRELEQRSGVNRETIRYYIREGLLPEPARASRNSALYGDEHLARLRAIRRLQDERFLPLAVIKALLTADDPARRIDPEVFPHLETEVLARLDGPGDGGWRALDAAAGALGISVDTLSDWARQGLVDLTAGPGGTLGLNNRDMAIAQRWQSLNERHPGGEDGGIGDCRVYVDMVDWLADHEIRQFFASTAGRLDEDEAIEVAEHGIRTVNDMLGLMRVRALAKRLNRLREEQRRAAPVKGASPRSNQES